jgi:exopolysaccharide biosynthesis polyprenyl glycosylphosphotransferase
MESRIKVTSVVLFFGFLLIWHLIFSGFGLYSSRRLSTRYDDVVDVLKATSLGTLIVSLFVILFRIKLGTSLFLLTFWAGNTAIAASSRLMVRSLLERLRRQGRNLRQILIAGTNSRAIRFAQKIEAKPELGYRLIGFVDDHWANFQKFQETGHSLVAGLKEVRDFLRSHVVDEVLICLPLKSYYEEVHEIIASCEEQGVKVGILSDLFSVKLAHLDIKQLEDESIITLSTGNIEGGLLLIKHALDFIISLCLTILFLPLLLITALLIKITSRGPVFFIQERLGFNKRRFAIHKFRTMIIDAEEKQTELEHLNEADGPVFKITKDPRITPLGKLLRKTSIDELPQLFNVLKGDMSLVGPRPLPLRDCEGFDRDWHRRRFSVRPGITCLWQVSGRSDIPFEKWMELDMEYIDNWSLWLDFKILMKTLPAVSRGHGAK